MQNNQLSQRRAGARRLPTGLRPAVEDFLLAQEVEGRAPTTRRFYHQILRHLAFFAGDVQCPGNPGKPRDLGHLPLGKEPLSDSTLIEHLDGA
jgi:hypothetical protein